MLKHDDRQAARADSGSKTVFLAALPGEVDQAHVVAEQLHVGDSIGINVGKRHPFYIGTNAGGASLCLVPDTEVLTMWRQPSPETLELRRAIRHQIEVLLQRSYGKFQAEGTPLRFVGLLHERDFMEQNSSTDDRL